MYFSNWQAPASDDDAEFTSNSSDEYDDEEEEEYTDEEYSEEEFEEEQEEGKPRTDDRSGNLNYIDSSITKSDNVSTPNISGAHKNRHKHRPRRAI